MVKYQYSWHGPANWAACEHKEGKISMENPNKKFPAGNKKYISLHTLKSRDSTQLKQTEGKFGTEGLGVSA